MYARSFYHVVLCLSIFWWQIDPEIIRNHLSVSGKKCAIYHRLENSSFKLKWNWFSLCEFQESFRNWLLHSIRYFWHCWSKNWSIFQPYTLSYCSLRILILVRFKEIRLKTSKTISCRVYNFGSNVGQRSSYNRKRKYSLLV